VRVNREKRKVGRAAALAAAVLMTAVAVLAPGFATGADAGARDFSKDGAVASPYVVGGTTVDAAKHPWQVVITANGNEFCGGVLIHPMIVLTAAHCLVDDDGSYFEDNPGINFRAFTGQTRLGIGGEELDWKISRASPNFDPVTDRHDWGLISLNSPASAKPIELAGADETALWKAGRKATVTGFGDLDNDGKAAMTLHQLELPVLADSGCRNYGSRFDRHTMLCAGYPAGGKDSCTGDSGGPLTVRTDEGDRRLIGLVSFGIGCAKAGFPGIYTRVADPDMSYAIEQSVLAVETADNFPEQYRGLAVTGSGATPYGCAASVKARKAALKRVVSKRVALRTARASGNRSRINAARRNLTKSNFQLKQSRKKAKKACS